MTGNSKWFSSLLHTALILLALIAFPTRVRADQNFYVSPSGLDTNDCLSATTACQSPNRVLAAGLNRTQTSNVIVNFDVGNYFSPAFASDGGAPTQADGKALLDLEGISFGPNASLTLLCSTNQLNPSGLVVGAVDAGVLGNYEGWVQIAIDGGLGTTGQFANDAGYCYMDGGVCVANTNALVGTYIQFTTGAGLVTAPIVSNTTGAGAVTINYVAHSATFGATPVAPTGASKFNLFAPASHFKPWPSDAGVTTGYALATMWLGGNSTDETPDAVYAPTASTRIFSLNPQITMQYCDLTDAPQSANANFEVVDHYGPGIVSIRNSNIVGSASAAGVLNYSGNLELAGDYMNVPLADVGGESGRVLLTGDLLKGGGSSAGPVDVFGTSVEMYNDVLAPTDGSRVVRGAYDSKLYFTDSFINQGNSLNPAVVTTNWSNIYSGSLLLQTDGGAGFFSCGASGTTSLAGFTAPDAGYKLYSYDNGVTYITGTAYLAIDGGSAGVHANCDLGTGCCLSSY